MHGNHGHALSRGFAQNRMTALLALQYKSGPLQGSEDILRADARKPLDHRTLSSERDAKDNSEGDCRVCVGLLRKRVPVLFRRLDVKL